LLSFHTLFPQLNTTHPNPLSTRFGRIEAQVEVGAIRALLHEAWQPAGMNNYGTGCSSFQRA